jgi:hypothetical protein
MTIESDELISYYEGWFAGIQPNGFGRRVMFFKKMPDII